MGGACSTYGTRKAYTEFWWGNPMERGHLENPGIDGGVIFRWMFRNWDGDVDWIYLAQDKDSWRVLRENELSGSIKCGEFLHRLRTS